MKNIINVTTSVIGNETVNSVNAREVYEYLGVKTEYPLWFKRTVDKYDFKEGEEVRKYFIQIEKEYRKQQEKPMSTTEMMIAQLQKQLELEKNVNQVNQKLTTLDNKLAKECGLSNNTIKRVLKIVKPVKKFVKKMRKTSYPIGKTFYRSPLVGFKWQNI